MDKIKLPVPKKNILKKRDFIIAVFSVSPYQIFVAIINFHNFIVEKLFITKLSIDILMAKVRPLRYYCR